MEYTKKSDGKTKWIDCYNSSQKILLVGEGDFSFSACLAGAFGTAKNIIATSYLDEDSLVEKHWTGIPHLEELERLGCLLLYEINVHNMHTHPILKNSKFDIIIFNFPHAGHYNYLHETNKNFIQMHRELVRGFFKSASKMLSEGGEVHIRHRDDYPYDKWGVVSLGGEFGFKLKEKALFCKSLYPGYHHKRGGDINTNKTFPIGYAFTFKFSLGVPKVDVNVLEMKNDVDDDVVRMFRGLCLACNEVDGDVDKKGDDKDNKNEDAYEDDYNRDYYYINDYNDEKYEYDNPW